MQFAFSPTRLEKEVEILINKKHSDLLSIFMHQRRKMVYVQKSVYWFGFAHLWLFE